MGLHQLQPARLLQWIWGIPRQTDIRLSGRHPLVKLGCLLRKSTHRARDPGAVSCGMDILPVVANR